jgi:hydrogenase maturation protease
MIHCEQHRKVLLLGIGNTVLTDDGIGIHAVRLVRQRAENAGVSVKEAEVAGFALLDVLDGYDAVVVVDAVRLADSMPGDVIVVDAETMPPSLHLVAGHQVDLPTALALGRESGAHMPLRATVVGVQIEDDRTFGMEPTPAVAAVAEHAGDLALQLALAMTAD